MIEVDHYGLHWAAGNIGFLMQAGGHQNALGLPLSCPFTVVPTCRSVRCNHQIDLHSFLDTNLPGFVDDPLIQAMAPIPKKEPRPAYLVETSDINVVIHKLCKMSWGIRPPIVPLWATHLKAIRKELSITNVQPLVITKCEPKDRSDIEIIIDMATMAPRKLILMGSNELFLGKKVETLETTLTPDVVLYHQDWQRIGTTLLKKEMLK